MKQQKVYIKADTPYKPGDIFICTVIGEYRVEELARWELPTTFPDEEDIYFCKTEEGKKKMFYFQNKLWYDAGIVVKESFLWLNDEI